ncbi:MAG: M20/M25/M40 family metallo-hydrolase [Flavobacteriaceae bacterium]|nr:M20/M25/M40 family metallo-hydrolase [Flavobacteriaceae bacterium]
MRNFYFIFLLLILFSCKTSDSVAEYKVDSNRIKNTVTYLASDELAGRNTGTPGIEKAALFLEGELNQYGVKPFFDDYRDNFDVKGTQAFNIVGIVEGNDPKLKNEYILVGAHYDHIGFGAKVEMDSIANGANDNATGTATVLELARFFAKTKSNKRGIIVAFFSAEEKGLVGSKHLAERFKDENVIPFTVLNFEMTGVPLNTDEYLAFVTGYDMSNLPQLINSYANENLVGKSPVAVQYNLFKRSDNYAFYEVLNIPSHTISTCDLTNFDHYHKVGDEADIMNYEHMATLSRRMIDVVEKMANDENATIKLTNE